MTQRRVIMLEANSEERIELSDELFTTYMGGSFSRRSARQNYWFEGRIMCTYLQGGTLIVDLLFYGVNHNGNMAPGTWSQLIEGGRPKLRQRVVLSALSNPRKDVVGRLTFDMAAGDEQITFVPASVATMVCANQLP